MNNFDCVQSELQSKTQATVHDVLVGSDGAPILALKGLRLKAMAPADDQKFTLDR